MSFLWDSLYSVFERTRNYLVDPPGEENPENPELAITGEGRGATISVKDLIAGVGAATKTFAPGGKHPRAATDRESSLAKD